MAMNDEDKLKQLQSLFKNNNNSFELPQEEVKPERPGIAKQFFNGIAQGTSKTVGELTEVLPELAYTLFGNTEAADKKRKEWETRLSNLDKNYPITPINEIGDSPLSAVASLLGESVPTLATLLIPGTLAAKGIAKAVPALATRTAEGLAVPGKIATAAGLGAAGVATGVPSSFAEIESRTGQRAPGTALVAGALEGALNAIPGYTALDRFGKKALFNSVYKRALAEGAFQGAIGAGAGGASSAIQEVATAFVDQNKADLSNVVYGMLAGGIQGGVMGAGIGALHKKPDASSIKPPTPYDDSGISFGQDANDLANNRDVERQALLKQREEEAALRLQREDAAYSSIPRENISPSYDESGVGFAEDASNAGRMIEANRQARTQADAEFGNLRAHREADALSNRPENESPPYGATPEENMALFERRAASEEAKIPPGEEPSRIEREDFHTREDMSSRASFPEPNAPRDLTEVLTRLTSEDGLGLKPGDRVDPADIKRMAEVGGFEARRILEDMKRQGLLEVVDGKARIKKDAPEVPQDQVRTRELLDAARKTTLGEPKELITSKVLDEIHDDLLAKKPDKINQRFLRETYPDYDTKELWKQLVLEKYLSGKSGPTGDRKILTKGQRENSVLLREANALKKNLPQASTLGPHPLFYSALEKAVEALPMNKAPVEQWVATLKNLKGVKQNEINWTDFYNHPWNTDKLSKDQVLDYLKSKSLNLKETEYRHASEKERQAFFDAREAAYRSSPEYVKLKDYIDDLEEVRDNPNSEKAIPLLRHLVKENLLAPDYYSEHHIKTNTRNRIRNAISDLEDAMHEKTIDLLAEVKKEFPETNDPVYEQYTIPGEKTDYTERTIELPKHSYKEGHWGSGPIIMHLRHALRKLINGETTFHLDELQSKAFSKLHKYGEQIELKDGEVPPGFNIVPDGKAWLIVYPEHYSLNSEMILTKKGAIRIAQDVYNDYTVEKLPLTKEWIDYGLKRALRAAVDSGASRFSWTPGEWQKRIYGNTEATKIYDEVIPSLLRDKLKKYGVKIERDALEAFITKDTRLESPVVNSFEITPEMRADFGQQQPIWHKLFERASKDLEDGDVEAVHGIHELSNNWVTDHIYNYLEKFAPSASLKIYERLEASLKGGNKTYWQGAVMPDRLIALAVGHLDSAETRQYLGTLDHEIVHFLEKSGLISEEEYKTLKNTATKENWIDSNGIKEAYPDLKNQHNKLLDEAIAEQYRKWHAKQVPDAKGFFQKVKNLFMGMLKKAEGDGAIEIFKKIASGEIGQRKLAASKSMDYVVRTSEMRPWASQVEWTNKDTVKNLGALDQMWHTVRGLADKHDIFRRWADGLELRRETRTLMRSKYTQRFGGILSKAQDREGIMRFLEAAEYKKEALDFKGDTARISVDGDTFLSRKGDVLTIKGKDVESLRNLQTAMFDFRNEIADSLMARLGYDKKMTTAELRATGDERDANVAKLLETLYAHPNYFPHMRFGDVGISVHDPVKPDGKPLHFQTFEIPGRPGSITRKLARKVADKTMRLEAEKLKKKYPGMTVSQPFDMTYDKYKQMLGNPVSNLRAAIDMFATGDEGLSKKAFDDIEAHLAARNLKLNFLERENIPGWINDTNAKSYLDQALNAYVMRGSSAIANNKAYKRIQEGFDELHKAGNPSYTEYANKVMEDVNSGREDMQTLKNISFMYYMGLNLSSAMMNASQTLHTTLPLINVIGGASGNTDVLRGYKIAMKMLKDHRTILTGGNPLDILHGDLRKYFGNDEKKIKAFEETMMDGVLAPMQAFEFAGNEHGDFATLVNTKTNLSKVAQLSASFFSTAEIFNRISTWSAFYDTFQRKGSIEKAERIFGKHGTWMVLHDGAGINPIKAAKFMTNKSQFLMDAGNKAQMQRGPVMGVITQFMSYNLQMLELWNQMLGKKSGIEGKKVAALMALGMVGTSGIWSLPAFGNIKDGVEALYKLITDQGLDLDKEVKEIFDEIATYPQFATHMTRGFLPAATDTALASRAGAGRILNTQALSGNLDNLLGPSWSMTAGSAQAALDQWRNGHPLLAIGEVLPIAAQNALKAIETNKKGYKSAAGKLYLKPEDVSPNNVLMQFAGFRPESVGRTSDYYQAQKNLGNRLDGLTKHFHQNAAQYQEALMTAKNPQDAQEARKNLNLLFDEVRAYNKDKSPGDQIKLSKSSIQELVKQGLSTRGNIKGVPLRMRQDALKLKPLYGVE